MAKLTDLRNRSVTNLSDGVCIIQAGENLEVVLNIVHKLIAMKKHNENE